MSLDLTRVVGQVSSMVGELRESRGEWQKRVQSALDTLGDRAIDLDGLKAKIAASRTTWLVADLVEGLDSRYAQPPIPTDFTVVAADGSHIDVDRHRSARCFLINTGSASLTYGSRADATLESHPRLYSSEADLVISPAGGGREQPIEGTLLGVKRSVEECRHLATLASGLPAGTTTLGLLDGTLILWGLSTDVYPEFVQQALLTDGLLPCLEDLRKLNRDRRLALASYISFPRSTDVVNVLRVAICPYNPADCDRHCPPGKERDCDAVAGVRDRDLFQELLGSGERSALFISPSKIVKQRYGEHRVYFCYLKLEEEVARLEMPQWVAENDGLLELAHGLVLDQCRRGHGYPVALSEAHEQAVVTGADRAGFWELVESALAEAHMPGQGSAKDFSKRTRWV